MQLLSGECQNQDNTSTMVVNAIVLATWLSLPITANRRIDNNILTCLLQEVTNLLEVGIPADDTDLQDLTNKSIWTIYKFVCIRIILFDQNQFLPRR